MANEVSTQLSPSRLPINSALARDYDLSPANWRVLVESIFPAAKSVEAVLMALAYCKARNLDIYKRPVHIVPMYDSKKKAYVETVWEGIASIRTTASRTGAYAGIDAVEYGPTIKHAFKGERDIWERGQKTGTERVEKTVEYPEWASVIVYRMISGQRCAYHAKVFWRETYATMGKMDVPNEMWGKRPFGQLDKCVEAAALRKAFPEELGSTYTADEMEGRMIDMDVTETPVALTPPRPDAKPKEEPKDKPKDKPKTPPKPKPKQQEEDRQEEDRGDEGQGEEEQGDGVEDMGKTPGELLSALDDELGDAADAATLEEVWNAHDIEAVLSSLPQGDEFQSVALGIKRRHLKRIGK